MTVRESDADIRLDRFLADRVPDLSRSRIQKGLSAGSVSVDGRRRLKSYRLSPGSVVRFTPPEIDPLRAVPQDLPLTVVHEDEHILVVDKPAGLVVHPAPGHPDGTLVNALLHHCRHLSAGGDPLRPGIVHRLDRDTSGLLVVALSETAHRELAAQLKQRTMGRTYYALSWGTWTQDEGEIDRAVGRHPRDRLKMAVLERGGRSALTRYRVEEDFGFVQLCRVSLQTGRTHQIRVHFTHAGHPVVGDQLYGDDGRARNVRPVERALAATLVRGTARQLLHAAELRLDHPATGRPLSFHCALPDDFESALTGLREVNPG